MPYRITRINDDHYLGKGAEIKAVCLISKFTSSSVPEDFEYSFYKFDLKPISDKEAAYYLLKGNHAGQE
jgi:hypothetical protein